jgi:hypothetical protein
MVAAFAAVAVGACSADEPDTAATGPANDAPATTSLSVRVVPGTPDAEPVVWSLTCDPADGDHPVAAESCALLETLDDDAFARVPDDALCTEIYGGDDTATVSGTLRGIPVDASFSRVNGCEIDRWDALFPLLPEPADPTAALEP